jgi:exonuclease-1
MKRVQMLIDNGIKPLIVFDGSELPAKIGTNEKRRQIRKENLAKAEELDKRGLESEADFHYKLAIDISPDVLLPVFKMLKKKNIDFIVAPYEADAQLSYLCRHKFCDFVITEDSDMIPYECPTTVFKLDNNGNCESIDYNHIFKLVIFKHFTSRMLLEACVLSGCDYLPSAPRIGIRTAIKMIGIHNTGEAAIEQAIKAGKVDFPEGYLENFREAVNVFRSQKVFDPSKKQTVPCFENNNSKLSGEDLPNEYAINFSEGLINPRTKRPFEGIELSEQDEVVIQIPDYSIPATESARKQFKCHFGSMELSPKVMKKPLLRYTPLYCGKRCQVPPTFTLPSKRFGLGG